MPFARVPNPNKPGAMKNFVCSPSNMSTYKLCPRRFQGSSLTGELPWKPSKAKSRGTLVHECVETGLKHGVHKLPVLPAGVDGYYITQKINEARGMIVDGGHLYTEHEMTLNHRMRPALEGWWDNDAILRAKADALVLPPEPEPLLLIDTKTGNKYDSDHFQLRVEALLAHLIYNRAVVNYEYWYVDSGETEDGSIDFRNGLAPVQDVIDLMNRMKVAITENNFPALKNRFCRWCGFHQTFNCGA